MADDDEKQVECPPGAPVWMCTFADLMSLLLCFFVLLLSFSVMDAPKYKQVSGSMKDAFGIQKDNKVTGSPSGNTMIATDFLSTPMAVRVQEDINYEVSEEINNGLIETELSYDGILLRMKDSLAFNFGQADLKPQFKVVLDKIGKILKEVDAQVTVDGHTDNVPLKEDGPFSSNWSLSTARSVAVVEYWVQKFNIPPNRLAAAGYADGNPLASNDTVDGRARNRRVEFRIKVNQQASTFGELKNLLVK